MCVSHVLAYIQSAWVIQKIRRNFRLNGPLKTCIFVFFDTFKNILSKKIVLKVLDNSVSD